MKGNDGLALVDTSCWIEYFHPQGSKRVQQVLMAALEEDRVGTCGAVICEVLRGAPLAEAAKIDSVFAGLHYLLQKDEEWSRVREAAQKLQRDGQQPPLLDMLIGALASRHQVRLWHFGDGHFKLIQSALGFQAVDLKSSAERA